MTTIAAPDIDVRVFQEFMATHLDRLNAYSRKLASYNPDLAKDLVQESVVKAFQQVQTGKMAADQLNLSWMLTVMRNSFLMHLRSNRRIVATAGDMDDFAPTTDGLTQFESAHVRQLIIDALELLPPDQRECVVLIDLQGLDYSEAASILDVPVGTIRSRLSRARSKLAIRLAFLKDSL